MSRSEADLAVAITGYAGAGAPDEEPGLVYIAAARRGNEPEVVENHFGDLGRGEVRLRCLQVAIEMLREKMESR